MGGRNHQPCGNYLPESTRLSKAISNAHIECERANVALEDLILMELSGGIGTIGGIVEHLSASSVFLGTSLEVADELMTKMAKNDFVDLLTLKAIDLAGIGCRFVELNIVDKKAWDETCAIMFKGGFRLMLEHFKNDIGEIQKLTIQLKAEIEQLNDVTDSGDANRVFEENLPGNIKVTFAKLYSYWDRFNALFLFSSMLSTEVWYAFRGYGSLIESAARTRVA